MHYAIADFLLDIVQNAVEAGAGRIECRFAQSPESIQVSIRDNGPGMDEATMAKARDPFYTDGKKHPGRRVGLGIPLLEQATEVAGGQFSLASLPGKGTTVEFAFDARNVDCPPVGDLVSAFAAVMSFDGGYELIISRELGADRQPVRGGRMVDGRMADGRMADGTSREGPAAYRLVRSELAAALGELESAGSRALLKEYVRSQESDITMNHNER